MRRDDPDAFIDLAEQTGLMRPLTLAVLEASLRQCRTWRDAGLDLTVAVNLSVSVLLDVRLPADVTRLLQLAGCDASTLVLEITENTLMADPIRGEEAVAALRWLGVGVAIDDYGTGYSSLSYLRQLSVDELKLDRSFLTAVDTDPSAAAIVRSTSDLAHSLGLRMVAEGVETAAAFDTLARLGVDVAQGYWLSRPVPAEQLTPWLVGRAARLPAAAVREARYASG